MPAASPLTRLVPPLLLIAALAGTVALSTAAWIVGVTCGLVTNAALAHGLYRYRLDGLSPADWVTLTRATLVAGVAALVADSFQEPAPVAMLVALSAVALALDAVDGWVARRTGTAATLGAHFDAEVDAFLILVLSVYVSRSSGAWVLAIGAARYAFLVAGWALPWMREPLPPRYWRKVVAAIQGIVLTVVAADVLPPAMTQVALLVALVLLGESFGRDVVWLRRHRDVTRERPAPDPGPDPGRARANVARALTVLSLLLVTLALVAPDQPSGLTPRAFLRLPLEALVVVALALVLPRTARRLMPWLLGPVLGVLVIVKLLDIGFLTLFDRRFDPIQDVGYAGTGIETLRASIGRSDGNLVVAVAVAVVVALLVFMTLALRRLTRVAADHRRWSLQAVAAAALVWALLWVSGAQLVPHTPLASASAAGLVVHEVRTAWADIRDPGVFAKEIGHDRFRATPSARLLTGLRGKDVVVAFVESYGKVAVQGSDFSPQVDSVLDRGTRQLRAAGFSSRTAFLTSSTFGGISWLAHSTLQSGLWVNSQRRYDQLVKTNRFTLNQAFKRAGWRTVDDVPSNNRTWPQGSSFYHYDKVYDRRDVGYRGPSFAYASMPDQYVLSALQRLELAKAHRRRVFAEVDLVSSHIPWTAIPRMVPWRDVGDGSVFKRLPADETTKSALFDDPARVRAAYGRSIQYTMSALISYVRHYGNRHLVLILLGDHQPWTVVSGHGASRDVPISVVTRDPAVLRRIASWGWGDGLRPGSHAPVWPMSAFRDRFLGAFDSRPAAP